MFNSRRPVGLNSEELMRSPQVTPPSLQGARDDASARVTTRSRARAEVPTSPVDGTAEPVDEEDSVANRAEWTETHHHRTLVASADPRMVWEPGEAVNIMGLHRKLGHPTAERLRGARG